MGATLSLAELEKDLGDGGTPAPFYLLLGASTWHRDRALELIRDAAVPAADRTMAETRGRAREADVTQLLDSARTLPLGVARRLVILADGGSLRAEELGQLADYAAAPPSTTTFVLAAEKLTSSGAVRTLRKSAVTVDCAEPRTWEMERWIEGELRRRGIRAERDVPRALHELLGDSPQEIAAGLDKLVLYVRDRPDGRISVRHVMTALSRVPHGTVWEFIEALEEKSAGGALRLLAAILEVGEPPESVLRLILRSRRQLLAGLSARATGSGDDAVLEAMGVSPKARRAPRVRRAILGRLSRHRLDEVCASIPLLLEADSRLKGAGAGGPEDILARLVLDLTGASSRPALQPSFRS